MPASSHSFRVSKTLGRNKPGAKRWSLQYGPSLVCVRHRLDDTTQQRMTTVELIVDTRPLSPPRTQKKRHPNTPVKVKLAHDDIERRKAALDAGAVWDPDQQVWRMPLKLAQALSVTGNIVTNSTTTTTITTT
jgi:hypothetical protein